MEDTVRERLRAIEAPEPATTEDTAGDRALGDEAASERGEEAESGADIVSRGLVGAIDVVDGTAHVELAVGAPHSPAETALAERVREAIEDLGYEPALSVAIDDETPAGRTDDAPIVIAVASGKGGVGKSTVAVNIAAGIADRGADVGIFDADVYGPNVPRMLGVREEMVQAGPNDTILPVDAHGMKVLSVGFLVENTDPVVWRGAVVDSMLTDLWHDVDWGGVDYVVVDLPPGTGDAQLTMLQQMPVMGAVTVTTPQDVALDNARKGVNQFEPHEAAVFGVVENMSTFVCPTCADTHEVFASGGGETLAAEFDVPLLSRIPLDPSIGDAGETGEPIVYGDGETAAIFERLAGDVMDEVGRRRRRAHVRGASADDGAGDAASDDGTRLR